MAFMERRQRLSDASTDGAVTMTSVAKPQSLQVSTAVAGDVHKEFEKLQRRKPFMNSFRNHSSRVPTDAEFTAAVDIEVPSK